MGTRHDYSVQALTYDSTRGASPSVLHPLRGALGPEPGPVLDIGGGTGNYALGLRSLGIDPVVLDFSAEMLSVAASKGLETVRCDAERLPVATASMGASIFVSMLHHVVSWRDALSEGRRVLRPGGVVAVMCFVREHLSVHWVTRYFPSTSASFVESHQDLGELVAELPGAEVTPLFYEDLVDGSLAAMCRRPEVLLDQDVRRQTSFFERAERDHPGELAVGLEHLRADLDAGGRPQDDRAELRRRLGDAVLIRWTAP